MLFFNSKKPVLADLIPNNYVDIHSHLLPDIDDGSPNLETSILLIQQLQKLGFSEFITTPHIMEVLYPNTELDILEVLKDTKIKLTKAGITAPFSASAEYMMDGAFIDKIDQKEIVTLKNNYVLAEMSYVNPPFNLFDIIFKLQVAGYQPILAHPERYAFYHNNLGNLKKLKDAGCLFQMNLLSTVGYYGAGVSKTADYLLANSLIDFVGSDVHHQKHVDSFYTKIVLKNHHKITQLLENNFVFSKKQTTFS